MSISSNVTDTQPCKEIDAIYECDCKKIYLYRSRNGFFSYEANTIWNYLTTDCERLKALVVLISCFESYCNVYETDFYFYVNDNVKTK